MATMRNYWKQFAEWATELKDDVFVRARIKLMLWYLGTTVGLLLLVNVALYFYQVNVLDVYLRQALGNIVLIDTIVRTISGDLFSFTLTMSIAILLVSLIISYVLAGFALRQLRLMMEAHKRFMADASHELRTPLSVMKTNSEVTLLEGPSLSAEEAAATIKNNLEEIDRMAKIIQNLLHLSHFDTKSIEMPFSKVNLSESVFRAVRSLEHMIQKKKITLTISRADLAIVWGNIVALEEVIINLLKNAITYTPKRGSINVSVKEINGQTVEFSIEDTGIGITAKDLPHIFEPFFKVDSSHSRELGGSSGLGLSIVREIIKQHHGSITAQSEPGKGTIVTITLPASAGVDVWERRKHPRPVSL